MTNKNEALSEFFDRVVFDVYSREEDIKLFMPELSRCFPTLSPDEKKRAALLMITANIFYRAYETDRSRDDRESFMKTVTELDSVGDEKGPAAIAVCPHCGKEI